MVRGIGITNMSYPLKRLCHFCKVLIYWNNKDKTQKETGSWYTWETNTIHDYSTCKRYEVINVPEEFVELEEGVRLRY